MRADGCLRAGLGVTGDDAALGAAVCGHPGRGDVHGRPPRHDFAFARSFMHFLCSALARLDAEPLGWDRRAGQAAAARRAVPHRRRNRPAAGVGRRRARPCGQQRLCRRAGARFRSGRERLRRARPVHEQELPRRGGRPGADRSDRPAALVARPRRIAGGRPAAGARRLAVAGARRRHLAVVALAPRRGGVADRRRRRGPGHHDAEPQFSRAADHVECDRRQPRMARPRRRLVLHAVSEPCPGLGLPRFPADPRAQRLLGACL